MDKICILIDSGNTRIKARAFVVGHPDASSDLNKAIIDEITIYNQEYARILGFVEKIQRQGQIVKVYGISVATENIRSDLENVFVSLNLKKLKSSNNLNQLFG